MTGFLAVLLAVLFNTPTESKWTVAKGAQTAGSVTLLTSANGTRAEWRATPQSPVVVFLARKDGKVWVRQSGGDVELAAYKGGVEKEIVPALLSTSANATYTKDDKGPAKVVVSGYTATRTALSISKADASNFTIRPKKAAAAQLARLSGDLLGPSQSTVSATAGGRGVGTAGLKLEAGGDYEAVAAIENRDAAWAANLAAALSEFQKDGKVGKGREQ